MPNLTLRYVLDMLGERLGREVFVLQIGAMDGKTHDPLHRHILRHDWQGVLVEPIAEPFAKLQQTYAQHPRLQLVCAAITETTGTATMHRIASEHVTQKHVPRWGLGAASLYTNRNALGFEAIRPFVQTENVPSMPLAQLLHDYGVERIDVLAIDAEGHDYHIFKQLDLRRYRPYLMNIECVNLPKDELHLLMHRMDEYGYLHLKAGYDLLCVHPDFFKDFA